MSETEHTPLPWRQHDSGTRVKGTSVCAILGSEYADFRDKVIASYIWKEADGQLIVTSVNARPKVEELVEMIESYHKRIVKGPTDFDIDSYPTATDIFAKNREVKAALGKAE